MIRAATYFHRRLVCLLEESEPKQRCTLTSLPAALLPRLRAPLVLSAAGFYYAWRQSPSHRCHRTDNEGTAQLVLRWQRASSGAQKGLDASRTLCRTRALTAARSRPPGCPARRTALTAPLPSTAHQSARRRPSESDHAGVEAAAAVRGLRPLRRGLSRLLGQPPPAPGAARLPRPGPAPQPPPTHQPRRAAPTAFPAAEGRLLRAAAPAPGSGTSQRDGTHQRPDGAPSSSFPFFARPRSAAPDPPASGSHRPPRGCERPRSGALTGPDRRCCAGARSAGGAAARPLYRPPPPRPRAQGRWRCVTSPGRRAEGRLTAAPGADAVPPGVRLPPPPPPGREGRVRLWGVWARSWWRGPVRFPRAGDRWAMEWGWGGVGARCSARSRWLCRVPGAGGALGGGPGEERLALGSACSVPNIRNVPQGPSLCYGSCVSQIETNGALLSCAISFRAPLGVALKHLFAPNTYLQWGNKIPTGTGGSLLSLFLHEKLLLLGGRLAAVRAVRWGAEAEPYPCSPCRAQPCGCAQAAKLPQAARGFPRDGSGRRQVWCCFAP